jgi:ribonuclease D
MNIKYIYNESELSEIEELVASSKYISLDTEFMRKDTYYAKLSLVQIKIGEMIFIIDALEFDVKRLWQSICESDAIKIIHSGRQDLEIFYHMFDLLPGQLFDTQVAASLCGFRIDSSYAELCLELCSINYINKSLQNAKWLSRPLTEDMIEYAAIDVLYLENIYETLNAKIKSKDLVMKFDNMIFETLLDKNLYQNNAIIEKLCKKIKYPDKSKYFNDKLREVIKFREYSAQALDIPRRNFLTDEQVIFISEFPSKIVNDYDNNIKNLSSYFKEQKYKFAIINICNKMW